MSQLQFLSFEEHEVRIVDDSANPGWVAVDIAKALGLARSTMRNRLAKMPEKWKRLETITTPGGEQKLTILLEPGLYSLIFRSDKPEAIRFQHWVFEEVLPSIRKTGRYELPDEARRRMRVVTELIMLKRDNNQNSLLVNTCNDLLDFTNGTAGFPQVSVEDAEKLLESAQMTTYSDTAFADIRTVLERALGIENLGFQSR